jgi:hypothetical protein
LLIPSLDSVDAIPVGSAVCMIQLSFVVYSIRSVIERGRFQLFILEGKSFAIKSVIKAVALLANNIQTGEDVVRLIVVTSVVGHWRKLGGSQKSERRQ